MQEKNCSFFLHRIVCINIYIYIYMYIYVNDDYCKFSIVLTEIQSAMYYSLHLFIISTRQYTTISLSENYGLQILLMLTPLLTQNNFTQKIFKNPNFYHSCIKNSCWYLKYTLIISHRCAFKNICFKI